MKLKIGNDYSYEELRKVLAIIHYIPLKDFNLEFLEILADSEESSIGHFNKLMCIKELQYRMLDMEGL